MVLLPGQQAAITQLPTIMAKVAITIVKSVATPPVIALANEQTEAGKGESISAKTT
ncbi:MAG TPA: hypothetical protein ACHBX0_14585 [Arsenophonus sp.]